MKLRIVRLLVALVAGALSSAPAVPAAEIDLAAKFALAQRLELGRSFGRALALYCEAAQKGHADAAYAVAWMFLNGAGMRRDTANGNAWLRVAAAAGNEAAVRWLVVAGDLTQIRQPHCRATMAGGALTRRQPPPEVLTLVHAAAAEAEIDPNLVLAVMAAESAFQPRAVSPKNAKGLMQLTDETARRFGVKDVFEPADNIRGGAQYLRWLLRNFDGDVTLALAGYNAGEKAVERYRGVPPYTETLGYIEKIRSRYPLTTLPR